jgi:iron(III) transport system substrate-binding protein
VVQQLIDRARKEGELNLVLSTSFFDGGNALPEFERAFNEYYGLNTKITRTPGPSHPEEVARLVQQVQAGRTPESDLFFGYESTTSSLIDANAAEFADWEALNPNIPRQVIAEGGFAVPYASKVYGVTYSEQAVAPSEVPKTLQDVLDPKWTGRIASTPYATPFDLLSQPGELGEQATTAFVTQLADQVGGLIRCGEYERLLSGEFAMLVMNCGSQSDLRAKQKGLPINAAILSDAIHIGYDHVAVVKGAKNVATATLFAAFLLTDPGQRLVYEADLEDLHLLPGSQTRSTLLQPLIDRGARLLGEGGINEQRKNAQMLPELLKQYQRLLTKQ